MFQVRYVLENVALHNLCESLTSCTAVGMYTTRIERVEAILTVASHLCDESKQLMPVPNSIPF